MPVEGDMVQADRYIQGIHSGTAPDTTYEVSHHDDIGRRLPVHDAQINGRLSPLHYGREAVSLHCRYPMAEYGIPRRCN